MDRYIHKDRNDNTFGPWIPATMAQFDQDPASAWIPVEVSRHFMASDWIKISRELPFEIFSLPV